MFKIVLQLHGGGKGSTTTVQSYQPTAEERRLMGQAADYSEAVMPNALRLNDTARDLLWDSLGSTQIDYTTLNNNAQQQIAGATNGLNNMVGANTAATNAANSAISAYAPQFSTLANNANNTLNANSTQYGNAANAANSMLDSYGTQYGNSADLANGALSLYGARYGGATDSTNSELGSYGAQYGNAANTANSTLTSINPQYGTAANSTNAQLAGLANGVVPSQYQTNMENSIRSALTNTMGNALTSLGNRGVLNSSVTNTAMNDISKNAADTVAQQYQQNINQSANLAQQQLGNTNTALGAEREIAQQLLGNTNSALQAQQGVAQQQLGNTNAALEAQAGLEQQRLGNTNAALNAQQGVTQQQLGNTNTALGAQSDLAQQQLGNSNNALEQLLSGSQLQLSNTTNANTLNAGLLGNLLESAAAPITVAAAAQEAQQQPALNLWNASIGLNQGGTGTALAGVSGKGTTTSTQSNNGGWWNGVGGLLGGVASAWCFAEDTLIKMADGTIKKIRHVVAGDKVVCPHADGTESEETVVAVMEPHYAEVYIVVAKGRDGKEHHCYTTSTQPLLCADGKFAQVKNIGMDKELFGGWKVTSIIHSGNRKVYDLKVTGENNYYADGFVAKGGTEEW